MISALDIANALEALIIAIQQGQYTKGKLGKPPRSANSFDVPGRGQYIYVRIEKAGQETLHQAINLGAPKIYDFPVLLTKSPVGDELIIFGPNPSELQTFMQNIPGGAVAPHTHDLQHGNADFVEMPRLLAGLGVIESGLTILIKEISSYRWDGVDVYFPGQSIDLTSNVPATANKHRWVKIGLDPSINTLVAANGTDYSIVSPLTGVELAAVAFSSSDVIPLLGVKLKNGQTSITRLEDLRDCRPWITGIGGRGSSGTFNTLDNVFTIQDNLDTTKQFQFQASGITAGQTRIYTVPDYNATLASLAGTETLSNKTLASPTVTGNITQIIGGQSVIISHAATATRNITLPDQSVTLIGYNASSQVIVPSGTKFMPVSDSTTAINIANAAGASQVIFDTTNGRVGIGSTPSAKLHVTGTADVIQSIVRGFSSQTVNLQEWQNSSGGVLADVTSAGAIRTASYLRVGAVSAPNNAIAGDLTSVRLSVGNQAFSASGRTVLITSTSTATSAGAEIMTGIIQTITPASNSSTQFRGISFGNVANPGTGITLNQVWSGYFENRIRGDGAVTEVIGVNSLAMIIDASSAATATVTTVIGVNASVYSRSGSTTVTLGTGIGFDTEDLLFGGGLTATTIMGFRMANPPAHTITSLIGMDIQALTRGSTDNIGLRIATPSGATNNYALQLSGTGGTSASGITFGTDMVVYRSAATTLAVSGGLLRIIQTTVGNEVHRIESTATNDDPTESVYQNRAATTDAAVTTLHTFTVPASTTYYIHAVVVARRTGGAAGTAEDGASYEIVARYKNVAGTATLIGAITNVATGEDQAGWDATFDVTGATVRVRITGAADNNITWHLTARVYPVGS